MNIDLNKLNKYVDEYIELKTLYQRNNFCQPDFKKYFNQCYTIRSKSDKWYTTFYNIFVRCKNYKLSFKEVLTKLYEETHEIHASFCSKMIALVYDDKPIWDQYVFDWLGFRIKKMPKDPYKRIDYCSKIYDEIEQEYKKHMEDDNVINALKQFDFINPFGIYLPKIKKLDFILRSIESDRTSSIFEYEDLSELMK